MFTLQDYKSTPDTIQQYNKEKQDLPIIIDNGSFQCRAGWSTSENPELIYKNVMAKNRANRKERDWDIQVGNEIADIEAVRWMVRSPYDFNVVVNFSAQETLLDYAFKHLGINTNDSVTHPIVITEPIANPSYCQKNMSELLFEAYSIPKVAFGIDCLFSYNNNCLGEDNDSTALIVSCGFQSTHVLPVIDRQPDIKNALRLNLGGYNCTAYLQWLLQYRHPQHVGEFTLNRMENLVHQLGKVAPNYSELVNQWTDSVFSAQHITEVSFTPRATNLAPRPGYMQSSYLALEKKLKQTEYKLYEVECVMDIEQENPEGAAKGCLDVGCDDMEELKLHAEGLQSEIDNIQSELDEEYRNESTVKQKNNMFKLGIEKFQSPEIIFQPSLVGYDQCGLSECIETVLQRYDATVQERLANNVFITGGNSKLNGFIERVSVDLRKIRPHTAPVCVKHASKPSLDAWKGAAKWANSDQCQSYFISKSDYEEFGAQYYKQHSFSNRWVDPTLNASK
uniref:Actin, non-muscle 6.2-like n=1 Tax=Phallusia mammillata TaxID=59560 RepID=A0A6F9D586_9ASCI|nr:actin, non-muscle 6.2-like [Phallusia mammillata]